MEFKVPYLMAMREQAPRMFRNLQRVGRLDGHANEKAREAQRMFEDLTRDAPKLPNGLPENPHRQEAERLVMETLIEFPPEETPEASAKPGKPSLKPFETLTPRQIAEDFRFVNALIALEKERGLGKFASMHQRPDRTSDLKQRLGRKPTRGTRPSEPR